MKKILTALTALVVLTGIATAQEPELYSEPGFYYPIQLSLYPTLQLINYENDVAGLRLNIIGVNRKMTGLDLGLINQTDDLFTGLGLGVVNLSRGDVHGLNFGFINHANGDVKGFQGIPLLSWWNAVNITHGTLNGAQGGLFNEANTLNGVQGGLVNISYDADGIMIGLYNYTETFRGLHIGLVNIAYKEMTGMQVGLYNGVQDASGFQLGLINQCQNLDGLQIGLVNVASQKETLPTMLFVNWKF